MVPDGKKITAYIAILAIRSCKTLFQLPHGCCRFSPTCSEYAKEALEKHPFFSALTLIFRRLLLCHPLHKGGFDPVPKKL